MYDYHINKSLISFEKYNFYNIFSNTDVSLFYSSLEYIKTEKELIYHYKNFGSYYIEDILKIYLGNENYIKFKEKLNKKKYNLIKNYCHPYSFKVLDWNSKNEFKSVKQLSRNKIIEDYMIVENSESCDCYDIIKTSNNFWLKVYGTKVVFQLHEKKQTLIFNCVVDDVIIEDKNTELKDYLIYSEDELIENKEYEKNTINTYFNEPLDEIIKEFMSMDIFYKRKTIIQFLDNDDEKYVNIALLLYELLSIRRKSYEFNSEKKIINLTIPYFLKKKLNNTVSNINKIVENGNSLEVDIPLDTKIKLLNVDEFVKSKLYMKFKELKSKSDDNSKVRQYLEGILSVPFGTYIEENIFKISKKIKKEEKKTIIEFIHNYDNLVDISKKNYSFFINNKLKILIEKKKKSELLQLNIKYKYKNKREIIKELLYEINDVKYNENAKDIFYNLNITDHAINEFFKLKFMNSEVDKLKTYINSINSILDISIHAHDNVKRELQRVFARWVTGELDGYCMGFEGPPGVGKTTIAKYGISECLKDSKGKKRPFNFLSLGGSNSSSLLNGHNYTYVGSTWGKLVDFLIKSKCMNPIIYIDELDKLSKTEHGNEITGILTHLTDSTQNDHISDKYFSGIPFDFSKVLFIFSYNDPSQIDPILLDRIHRIKFNYLKENEKLIVVKKYILPSLYEKIGLLEKFINIEDENILYIINNFTFESGVRKLKELLFTILSEINIKFINKEITIPLKITNEDIKNIYLKEKHENIHYSVNKCENRVYGMWANQYGLGGVLPINLKEFPSKTPLELKLTGLPGTVMKESMYVSQTLAWSYLTDEQKKSWNIKNVGLHIHCPDGSTNKDGPSAGSALTVSLILFLKNKQVNGSYGMTGEINLEGDVTAIGGLELKINGGIKAGIKKFIYPKENQCDFDKIEDKSKYDGIKFYSVGSLDEILNIIL